MGVDDWAVLLHASEKTQVPILRRALELIRIFDVDDSKENALKIKKHILATVLKEILSGNDSPAAKSDKISGVLQKFNDGDFGLKTTFTVSASLDPKVFDKGSKIIEKEITIAEAIFVSYGGMMAPASLIEFCETFICVEIKETIKIKSVVPYSLERFLEQQLICRH